MGSRRRCCVASSTKICVTACSGKPVYGALVELYSGSTLVASCTSASAGCCTFTQKGSYTVKVYVSGALDYSGTETLAGGTITIAIPSTSLVCCAGYVIPYGLTGTDANGSFTLTYQSGASGTYPTWMGCTTATVRSCTVTTPGGACTPAAPATQPVAICYLLQCQSSASPVFFVQRAWGWVNYGGVPTWYSQGSSPCSQAVLGAYCSPGPPGPCGSPLVDGSSCSANPSSSSPFALSCTPTPLAGNSTADPVGGLVAISA